MICPNCALHLKMTLVSTDAGGAITNVSIRDEKEGLLSGYLIDFWRHLFEKREYPSPVDISFDEETDTYTYRIHGGAYGTFKLGGYNEILYLVYKVD